MGLLGLIPYVSDLFNTVVWTAPSTALSIKNADTQKDLIMWINEHSKLEKEAAVGKKK